MSVEAERLLLELASLDGSRCQENDPEIWFSESRSNIAYAKKECSLCPALAECQGAALEYELETNGTLYGIYGGLTEKERRLIKKKRKGA